MATRTRWDIQIAIGFLTARVKDPDEDNWGKLKRVLKYLNGTKHLKLKLGVWDVEVVCGRLMQRPQGLLRIRWKVAHNGKRNHVKLLKKVEDEHL
jgi:hypothetical protein